MKEMPNPIPVVIVGCGAVSQSFYAPALRLLAARGDVVVEALVDPFATARAAMAESFPDVVCADRLADIKAPEGALVIIATPPRFHAEQTVEAFSRGWHVLCEKPMASSTAECEEMIAAAEASKRLLAVGLYKRFFPSSRYLKDLVAGGQLGALRKFSIAEGGPFKWPAATPSFFNKAQTPGGVLLDIGVHTLDLLTWWLGEPASFTYEDDAMGGLEINARVNLEFPNGARGSVHLSRDWATANEYRFEFDGGIASWKVNDANNLTVQLAGAPAAFQAHLVTPITGLDDILPRQSLATNPQSFIVQLQNVIGAIRGTESLLVTGPEGLRSLRLIEACYRKRTLIEQPWFSAVETARARELALQP
jgi:predicted dehydrogenase